MPPVSRAGGPASPTRKASASGDGDTRLTTLRRAITQDSLRSAAASSSPAGLEPTAGTGGSFRDCGFARHQVSDSRARRLQPSSARSRGVPAPLLAAAAGLRSLAASEAVCLDFRESRLHTRSACGRKFVFRPQVSSSSVPAALLWGGSALQPLRPERPTLIHQAAGLLVFASAVARRSRAALPLRFAAGRAEAGEPLSASEDVSARSVAASYKPPMLVTRVRLPACAYASCPWLPPLSRG